MRTKTEALAGNGGEASSRAADRALARIVAAGAVGLAAGAAPAAADGLVARGLVTRRGDGALVATAEGLARHARTAGGDAGFLAQHRQLGRRRLQTGAGLEEVTVDLDESPLAWLARRKGRDGRPLLDPASVLAGERLRADFTRAQMTPRVTANWEASVSRGRRGAGGGPTDLADAAIAAKARVNRALEAVGPELAGALVDVCCFLKGMEEVERERGWPARGAKLVLGLALESLARHYGYAAKPSDRPAKIVRWGTPDSRPTIDGGPPEPS